MKRSWRTDTVDKDRLSMERGRLVNRRRSVIHVWPVNDLRTHEANRGTSCWCNPRVDRHPKAVVVIHNSLDGRELIERHGIQ